MPKKELLFSVTRKDLRVDTFRAGGKGGQKQNKTSTGVRITHPESGAVGESREERSQAQNKKLAFRRMVESKTFQSWIKFKAVTLLESFAALERKIDDSMKEENLKIEYGVTGESN